MMSQESMMKKKLENMHLKERIDYGYRKVITMMLISGLLSVVIIGILFANMMHYVENVNVADQAVKICRINVNAAARNIREMALNEDTSSYDNYEQTVKRLLSEVDSELQILKKTEVLSDENYEEYSTALSDWGKIGYSIIEEIKNGNDENATDAILNDCTPALNKVVEIAIKLDELTDEASSETVRNMVVCTVAGFVVIIVCLVFAFTLTRKTSKRVLDEFENFKEVNLFLRGMFPLVGYSSDVVYYERNERFAGESKYPLKKMLNFAWDGITSFSVKPIRLVLNLGILIFAISLLVLLYCLIVKVCGKAVTGWTFVVSSIWLVAGIQMLSIGIIGEYIGKIYSETKARPRFIVSENLEEKNEENN